MKTQDAVEKDWMRDILFLIEVIKMDTCSVELFQMLESVHCAIEIYNAGGVEGTMKTQREVYEGVREEHF